MPLVNPVNEKGVKLVGLMHEARDSAAGRGHMLGMWKVTPHFSYASANCLKCGKPVDCVASPLSNEINIAGEVVAMRCKDA